MAHSTEESESELDFPVSSKAGKHALTRLDISDDEGEDSEDDVASPEKPAPRKKKTQPADRVPRAVVRSAKQQQLGELFFLFILLPYPHYNLLDQNASDAKISALEKKLKKAEALNRKNAQREPEIEGESLPNI